MPYEVVVSMYYEEAIEWLQENVGNLLWSRPIIEWKGEGWTMHSLGVRDRSTVIYKPQYLIRIDDAKLAMWAKIALS